MSTNYTLQYRTFEQFMADVSSDFKSYQLKNLIDEQDVVKIARKINYELGLRIHSTRERILHVERGKVRLPVDFYVFNFALSVGEYKIHQYFPQGTRVEERIIGKVAPQYQLPPPQVIDLCTVPIEPEACDPCDPCSQCGKRTEDCTPCRSCCSDPDSCSLTCKGEIVQLVQVVTSEVREFQRIQTMTLVNSTESVMEGCPNRRWKSQNTCEIRNGYLYTSFQTGKVYLNYQGQMVDDDGNLLVVDHPLLNEYYEYSAKKRILENLIMNDVEVQQFKVRIIEDGLRSARIAASNLVNTPNFSELKELFQANRIAQNFKYFDMFTSHPRN